MTPPRLFLRFFRWFCHPKLRDHIEGDLMEEYHERLKTSGERRADIVFIIDVLLLCHPEIVKPIRRYRNINTLGMYKSYFIVAVRNMLRQKMHNTLNVLGLSAAIASGLIIALHVRGELSYETSYPGFDNIYRVHRDGWAASSPVLAAEFKEFFPEVEVIGRFSPYGSRVVNTENNNPGEATGLYADSTVLAVFGFSVLDGDSHPLTALNSVVVTRTMAVRYFGTASPIGRVLKLGDGAEMIVTSVIDDPPVNSHLKFDFLVSMPTLYQHGGANVDQRRGWMIMYAYARLRPGTVDAVKEKMHSFIRQYYAGDHNIEQEVQSGGWRLMPLKDIHLHSNLEKEMQPNSNIVYIYIFMTIELLILIVASANFMSLFTTQALKRVREVGMRKIMGAKSVHLTSQFLMEVSLLIAISMFVGIILYEVALPFYNRITGKSLEPLAILALENLTMVGAILLTVIVLSGLYPAIFIAGFKARSFLRENRLPNSMPNFIRGGLLTFQFVVSVALIAAAMIVRQQMDLMKNKELGFDKDQVINVELYGTLRARAVNDADAFKNEFLKNPEILSVGRVDRIFGERLSVESVGPEGVPREDERVPDLRVLRADEGYLETMNIKLTEGRNFSREFNEFSSFIINESAAKVLGFSHPVGQTLVNHSNPRKGPIVGVVRDFHFATLHSDIEPLVIEFKPQWTDNIVFKIRAGKTQQTLDYIENTMNRLAPHSLLVYNFLDDRIDALYKAEDTIGKIFQFFSALAIVIACMGLFGLSSYTIERRAKEIGIRKVLGATTAGIVSLVSSPVFKLIVAGFCIAVPFTWYGMQKWLNNFAYKIEIEWWIFATTGAIIAAIAALAIGVQAIRAAAQNPVNVLRSE